MSGRRIFLKNVALGIAATLVPKILQPISGEVESEEDNQGVLWYIHTYGSEMDYKPGYFSINDLNKITFNYYDR